LRGGIGSGAELQLQAGEFGVELLRQQRTGGQSLDAQTRVCREA